jgi:DNA mismatch endonuclease (patch repair protein)
MDTLTFAERIERMSPARSKDTKPELLVRTLVHGREFRYRLHERHLSRNAAPEVSAIHDTQVLRNGSPR